MFPSYCDQQQEQDKLLEELLADCDENGGANNNNNKRQRRASLTSLNKFDRKTMHRDIERQRRQEMSALYASLRSLLPLEYIKGKRAVTDQLQQAGCYIKHMQEKIEKMQMRRDKLINKKKKKVFADHVDVVEIEKSRNSVKVSPCRDGVEILIGISNEWFGLSKVFEDLIGRSELNVISCVSTRASDDEWSSLHKIQIEASDPTSIDLSELEKRLANVIN